MLIMRLLAAALLGTALVSGHKQKLAMKIINGTAADASQYTYFALPTKAPGSKTWLGCGASIISPTFALTSAHCFGGGKQPCHGPQKLGVCVGNMTLGADWQVHAQFCTSATLVCNSEFNGKCSQGHDVALLKLDTPVPDSITPVLLDLDGSFSSAATGETVTSIGFGDRDKESDNLVIGGPSSSLRKVAVSVLPKDGDDCKRVLEHGWGCSDSFSEGPATNLDQQLCAGADDDGLERDTCAGDSGSPMMDSSGRQVAIVSYGGGPGGISSGPGRDCADPRYPGVYAYVAGLKEFILEHVKDLPGGQAAAAESLHQIHIHH